MVTKRRPLRPPTLRPRSGRPGSDPRPSAPRPRDDDRDGPLRKPGGPRTSPPGRPKGESLSALREGSSLIPPGRPKGESLSALREGSSLIPPGRPKGESLSALREDGRLTAVVVDHLSWLLGKVVRFDGPADAVMSRFFKEHAMLGGRERSLIAEACFHALRHFATLKWLLQPAVAVRAPRLAALVTLARQHGLAALGPRELRGDERAVRNALAIDLGSAPGAVRAELPLWLYSAVAAQYDDAESLLAALTEPAPLDLRVNILKTNRDEVLASLRAATREHAPVDAQPTRFSPEAIRLYDKPGLARWALYRDGLIEVQDEGSQLIARLVAPRRGEMVVDFCAGAGGKTLALGSLMRSSGRIYAFDINARRLAGLGPRLKRSGLSNVHPAAIDSENDPKVKRLAGKIDRVLVDAPCSGSGTLRRNPDLKWRFDEAELARVNAVQGKVLRAAARLVKPGGRLVYATCSLLALENQQVIEQFLRDHEQFEAVPAAEVLAQQGIDIDHGARFAPYFVMLPHLHGTDGFFAAVLERRRVQTRD